MLTNSDDYIGYFRLAKNKHTEDELEAYIQRFEEEALRCLLQCEYDNFINDLVDGVPQSQKWIDLFEPFYKCDDCGNDYFSRGILDLLKCFVWYNYSLESPAKNTIQGTVRQRGSSSEPLGTQFTRNHIVYNQFVNTFNAIMYCICESDEDYDIKRKYLEIIHPFM
jgi:hypothetical protein